MLGPLEKDRESPTRLHPLRAQPQSWAIDRDIWDGNHAPEYRIYSSRFVVTTDNASRFPPTATIPMSDPSTSSADPESDIQAAQKRQIEELQDVVNSLKGSKTGGSKTQQQCHQSYGRAVRRLISFLTLLQHLSWRTIEGRRTSIIHQQPQSKFVTGSRSSVLMTNADRTGSIAGTYSL